MSLNFSRRVFVCLDAQVVQF